VGNVATVTWTALDARSNPVTDPARQPDSVCIYAAAGDTVYLEISPNNYVAVTDQGYCFGAPFVNGVMENGFYSEKAGAFSVTVQVFYDNKTKTEQIDLVFMPGAPSRVEVVHLGDSTLAVMDTLVPFGSDSLTQQSYVALFYDQFGNLITDPQVTRDAVWASGHTANMSVSGNTMTYYAARSPGGNFTDTVIVRYPDDPLVVDTFFVYVVPIVGVVSLVTHEWIADPVLDKAGVEYVLGTVLGMALDSLRTAAGLEGKTEDDKFVEVLRDFHYSTSRDGYLDYLDLMLSDPLYLRLSHIDSICYHYVPKTGTVSGVRWTGAHLAVLDSGRTRYRLWLLPNGLDRLSPGVPLETGFLPVLYFNNVLVQAEQEAHLNPPTRLGGAADVYKVDSTAVRDSAPPVVHRFVYQNNECNPNIPLNGVKIGFSEPVRFSGVSVPQITAFTLINGTALDSVFMSAGKIDVNSASLSAEVLDERLEPFGTPDDADLVYGFQVAESGVYLFQPQVTQVRFSVMPGVFQFTDLWGNTGTHSANYAVTLENDPTVSAICNITGNTLVDRYDAMNFRWSKKEDETGALVDAPDFPFFGFEVNMGVLGTADMQVQNDNLLCGGTRYVVKDYDAGMLFLASEVRIFDILGNLTADPLANPSLSIQYTTAEVHEVLGIQEIDCSRLNDYLNNGKYYQKPGDPGAPDTLIPKYPGKLIIGYEFMMKVCGPRSGKPACVPSWNCLNRKGRLVAPGGYIASQIITTAQSREYVTHKFIVTSRKHSGL
jgi:hypothetical protein